MLKVWPARPPSTRAGPALRDVKWLAPTLNRRWHEKSLAVRVGLALVEAVAALPAPERLQARVGIATGLVVVGDLAGASPEHEVVGEAPNLAARLQALAAPDSVLIASTTRRLVGAALALDPVGSLRLKGW